MHNPVQVVSVGDPVWLAAQVASQQRLAELGAGDEPELHAGDFGGPRTSQMDGEQHQTMTARPDPTSIQVPILWIGVEEVPVVLANQFLGQVQQDEIIFTVGVITPPVIVGDETQRRQQAERLGYVQVRPSARFTLTRSRLDELIKVARELAENYDRVHQRGGGTGNVAD